MKAELREHLASLTREQRLTYEGLVECYRNGGWVPAISGGWSAVVGSALRGVGCSDRVSWVLGRAIAEVEIASLP